MAINEVLGLTLDLSANTDKFVRDLRQAASSVQLDFKPLVKRFSGAQQDIQKILSSTVADAAAAGFGRTNIQGFAKKLEPLKDQIESSMKRMFDLEIKVRDAADKNRDATAEKNALELERKKLGELKKRFEYEKKATDRLLERRKQALQEAERIAARSFSDAGKEFGENLQGAFDKIKGGDFGGLLEKLGKGMAARGTAAQERAKAGKGIIGDKGARLLGKLGGMLSKIGPAIAAIGALAAGLQAGIGALVAVVVSVDSAMKSLNRTLLESGVSGADLANQYNMLGDTLDRIRKSFTDAFTFNQLWGTTAKDHLEILGAYASAGVTFREMTEGVKKAGTEMERLKDYTVMALTYSKLLGMSTQEISATMASYMEELGFTLEGVAARFSNIASAAKESGFATKRFFNMLLQATSGMSMYNVRLEEAAGLLMQLGAILGEKMGGDFLGQLMKGFKDESTQDRIRKTMTTGVGYSLEVLKKDAINTSEEFKRKLDELGKSNADAQAGLSAALAEVGVTGDMGAEDLVRKLSTLSGAQQAKLLAKAEQSKSPAMVRMLGELMNKSSAFKGGLAGAQAARQFAGGGASMLLQLGELKRITGGKRLDQISLTDMKMRLAAENITGKQGEEYLKLFEVGRRFSGRQDVIAEEQKKIREAGSAEEADRLAREFNEKFGEQFGMVLDATGARRKLKRDLSGRADVDDTTGEVLGDTFEDLMLTLGDDLLGQDEQKVAEDILLAQEIAANTTDMAKILEQGVEYLLSKIYNAVQYIASIFGKGQYTEKEAATRGKAQGEMSEELMATRKEIRLREAALEDLERKMRTASPEDKEKMKEKIAEHRKAINLATGRAKIQAASLRAVGRLEKDEAARFGDLTSTTHFKEAAGAQYGVQQVMVDELKKRGVDVSGKAAAAAEAVKQDIESKSAWYLPITSYFNEKEIPKLQAAARERVISPAARDMFGTAAGVGKFDASMWSAFNITDVEGKAGPLKSLDETLGSSLVDQQDLADQSADERDKRHLTVEEKQKQAAVKKTLEGIKEIEAKKEVRELAGDLARFGVAGSPESLMRKAQGMLESGRLPAGMELGNKVYDPDTGTERRLGDVLMSRHKSPEMSRAILGKIGAEAAPAPAANDFLMQIGEGGRIKFAQRIDSADTVTAVASKSGGAISGASRGGRGGGGVTIVQHNYSDMEAIKKGWKALQAARALG